MEQKLLYLDDSYIREFDATVISVKDGKYIVLDQTAFYPQGGGQPHDTGIVIDSRGNKYRVVYVGKFDGVVSIEVDKPGLKEGERLHCLIDWKRRYKLMRYHTAAHVLSAVFSKESGALITGNQLNIEKSRFDFNIPEFNRDLMDEYVEKANKVISEGRRVRIYYLPRDEVEKQGLTKLAKGLPKGLELLRIVEIEDFDIQADGGTHVKNTAEIGRIEVLKYENKGKNNRRIYFRIS